MELKISCLPTDERRYSVEYRDEIHYLDATELKQRLLDFGVGDSTIAAVLDISPNDTMTIKAAVKAA